MKRFVYLISIMAGLISCNKEVDQKGESVLVKCITGDAIEITQSSAKIVGMATINNTSSTGTVCFYYSTTNGDMAALKGGKKADAGTIIGDGGSFSVTLSGLAPATVYYYVASAIVKGEESFGEIKSFTTKEKPSDPAVTGDVTDITENSVTLYGSVNPTSDMQDVMMGILFSINSNPTIENSQKVKVNDVKDNSFSVGLQNLSSSTVYYYKTYLQFNGAQYKFGEIKSFTTLDVKAVVTTQEVTDVTEFSATIHGKVTEDNKGKLSKRARFYISNTGTTYEDILSSYVLSIWADVKEDGSFESLAENLAYGVKYYYIAEVYVHDKVFISEVSSFETRSFDVNVQTKDVTDITEFQATLNAILTVNSKEELEKQVWFWLSDTHTTLDEFLSGERQEQQVSLENNGSFKAVFKNLKYNSTYYYVAVARVHDKLFYSDVASFYTLDFTATAQTTGATDIGPFKAKLNGDLTINSKDDIKNSTVCFYYGDKAYLEDLVYNGTKVKGTLQGDGSFCSATGVLEYSTKYYYVVEAKVLDKVYYGDVINFITPSVPEVVDLGLSVKWRGWNLGASSPEGNGDMYAWGEIETKETYTWSNYKWIDYYWGPYSYSVTKYNTVEKHGVVDNRIVLEPEDDVATVKLGGDWRIPTYDEWYELFLESYNNRVWVTQHGVKGTLITGPNGNSIFLPVTDCWFQGKYYEAGEERGGSYWSSTLGGEGKGDNYSSKAASAHAVYQEPNKYLMVDYYGSYPNRESGYHVRPVTKK